MKYKHIEAARELRLWLAQIVIPLVGLAALSPETRQTVSQIFNDVKHSIKKTRR